MEIILDGEVLLKGDITTNLWAGARSAGALEKSLGYGAGRLSAGWAVLVLKQRLSPDDFVFGGLTIRSGGRLGLPGKTAGLNEARPTVHQQAMQDYGQAGYQKMQLDALASITEKGSGRLVKILPVTRHDGDLSPARQYPMGGGGLQWNLIRPCRFKVAMTVDAWKIARIPGYSATLGEHVQLHMRSRLARHIEDV